MPTINKRFLLRLLLGVAVVTGLVAGVHVVQARRIPAALLAQADRAADAGKADAAVNYLRQYLEFRPADADALARLAGLLRDRPLAAGAPTFDAALGQPLGEFLKSTALVTEFHGRAASPAPAVRQGAAGRPRSGPPSARTPWPWP